VRQFEYTSPKSKQQAVGLLGKSFDETAVLAGGTDLLALMKDDVVHPKRLVNIKQVAELRGITLQPPGLRIGALATLDELAIHADVRSHFPILHEAIWEAASPQIRNVATIGGNLCQRPRCWYFRNGMGLLAQQNGESLVLKGDNRYHAILGNDGAALFVSPSTIVPVLIAHGAKVRIVGPSKAREIALENLYRAPKTESERELDLAPDEIVTEITIPAADANTKTGYYEVRQKEAFDWPYASCAVVLKMSGANVASARVVLNQVAPTPWISEEAATALVGKPLNEETAMSAASAALSKAKSLSHNKYKITLAKVAVKRAILAAANPKSHTGNQG
jgi:xanthine dehydrogenase YagS FAD-binding subunit